MTNNKTNKASASGAKKPGAGAAVANRPAQRRPGGGPAPAVAAAGPNLDETIAKAQKGRVNVTPAKAIEMAGQLYSRGQYAQAERVCRQIISARPGNADAHNILGVSLAALGKSDDAVTELGRAIKINGEAPSYHANLGEILRQAGRLDEAAKALETAIKLEANNAQALNNLGIIQYEKRNFKKAVEYYRRALAINPTDAGSAEQSRQCLAHDRRRRRCAARLSGSADATRGLSGGLQQSWDLASAGPQVRRGGARPSQGDPAEPALCRGA